MWARGSLVHLSSFSFVPIISQVLKQLQFSLKGKQFLMYCACEHAFSTTVDMWKVCRREHKSMQFPPFPQFFPKSNRKCNMYMQHVMFFALLVSLGTHDIWKVSSGSTGQIAVRLLNSIPMPYAIPTGNLL